MIGVMIAAIVCYAIAGISSIIKANASDTFVGTLANMLMDCFCIAGLILTMWLIYWGLNI